MADQMGQAAPYSDPGAAQAAGPGPAQDPADTAMMQQEEADMAEREAISASAPQPDKPYSVKKIQSLLEEFKKTIKKLAEQVPTDGVVWEAPAGEKQWDAPLPDPVFPAMVLVQAILETAGPDFVSKHGFDPMELKNDAQLAKAQAKIRQMGSDKKLKKTLDEMADGSAEGEPATPPEAEKPEAEEEVDEELMQSM